LPSSAGWLEEGFVAAGLHAPRRDSRVDNFETNHRLGQKDLYEFQIKPCRAIREINYF